MSILSFYNIAKGVLLGGGEGGGCAVEYVLLEVGYTDCSLRRRQDACEVADPWWSHWED